MRENKVLTLKKKKKKSLISLIETHQLKKLYKKILYL